MRRGMRIGAVVLVALAVVAAGCAKKTPSGAGGGGTASVLPGTGMLVGQVTDTGGIDDKSFNQTAWKGVLDAETKYGVTGKYLESSVAADYMPNIQAFLGQNSDLIITVGFLLGDDTAKAAKQNPNQKFAIVDYAYDPPMPNVLGLTFKTDDAAFLAGYLAAGMTKTGKVGTFGGMKIPTVTIFMNGFAAGVLKYNQDNGTNVQVLGWNAKTQNGTFTGDFEDQNKGKQVTQNMISEGADIIMPVAGPVGLGAAAAAEDAGNVMMIGVDTDQYVSAPEYKDLWLTSVMKNMDVAVTDAVGQVVNGDFKGGTYVGTLANKGVGIAPFHNFDTKVPATLKSQLETLKKGIVDGSISVDPKSYQ